MIEKTILEYLQSHIEAPVYLEKPPDQPKKFVLVEKTGSSRTNHIDGATIAIQSYAKSMVETIELNEEVKRVMDGIIELDEIGGCDFDTDYNYTDPSTKQYRYQAVYFITYYGGNENG